MDMRMKVELLAPGVQYAEETDLCTEVPRITTNFEKSLRTGAEQEIVNDLLVLQHQRSEEHTSELQSQSNLVCRLLLEKKKKKTSPHMSHQQYINFVILIPRLCAQL